MKICLWHEMILGIYEFIYHNFIQAFILDFYFIFNLRVIWVYLWGTTQPEYWCIYHPSEILSWSLIFSWIRNTYQHDTIGEKWVRFRIPAHKTIQVNYFFIKDRIAVGEKLWNIAQWEICFEITLRNLCRDLFTGNSAQIYKVSLMIHGSWIWAGEKLVNH